MKRILIIITLIISVYCNAQTNNFIVENNLITWKNTYTNSMNISKLKSNPRLEFKTDSTGLIKKTNFDDKKLRDFSGEFKVVSKNGKYEVIVNNMKFYTEPTSVYGGKFGEESQTEYLIEDSLLSKSGKIREYTVGTKVTDILNTHLVELFTIQ